MAINVSSGVEELFRTFSLSEYLSTITPLLLVIVGILIYAFFIFKFYRFLATKDILKLELHKHARKFEGVFLKNLAHIILYIIENIILIPIFVFIWFVVLALFLLVISTNHSPETIILTALAFVAAVRVISYYNEDFSRDLAKLIPLTLLAIFLIDYVAAFSLQISFDTAVEFLSLWKLMISYLVFVTAVELFLRVLSIIVSVARGETSRQQTAGPKT